MNSHGDRDLPQIIMRSLVFKEASMTASQEGFLKNGPSKLSATVLLISFALICFFKQGILVRTLEDLEVAAAFLCAVTGWQV